MGRYQPGIAGADCGVRENDLGDGESEEMIYRSELSELIQACQEHAAEIRQGKRTLSQRFEKVCGHCGQLYPKQREICRACRCELIANPEFKPL